MKEMSVSFVTAPNRTSIAHNNRTKTVHHADKERASWNKFLISNSLEETYEFVFGEAVDKYNQKQKREDRKIKNYLSKIRQSGTTNPQHEMLLQIGNMDDFNIQRVGDKWKVDNKEVWDASLKILEDYVREFQTRNPNLIIYNASIHLDEATPHLHLNFVPWHEVGKNGIEKKVGLSNALLQQRSGGRSVANVNLEHLKKKHAKPIPTNATVEEVKAIKKENKSNFDTARKNLLHEVWKEWRDSEIKHVVSKMKELNLGHKVVGANHPHLELKEYKKAKKEVDRLVDVQLEANKRLSKTNNSVKVEQDRLNHLKTLKNELIGEFDPIKDLANDNIRLKRELNTQKGLVVKLNRLFDFLKRFFGERYMDDAVNDFNIQSEDPVIEEEIYTAEELLLNKINEAITIDVSDMQPEDDNGMEI